MALNVGRRAWSLLPQLRLGLPLSQSGADRGEQVGCSPRCSGVSPPCPWSRRTRRVTTMAPTVMGVANSFHLWAAYAARRPTRSKTMAFRSRCQVFILVPFGSGLLAALSRWGRAGSAVSPRRSARSPALLRGRCRAPDKRKSPHLSLRSGVGLRTRGASYKDVRVAGGGPQFSAAVSSLTKLRLIRRPVQGCGVEPVLHHGEQGLELGLKVLELLDGSPGPP